WMGPAEFKVAKSKSVRPAENSARDLALASRMNRRKRRATPAVPRDVPEETCRWRVQVLVENRSRCDPLAISNWDVEKWIAEMTNKPGRCSHEQTKICSPRAQCASM